CVMLNPALTVQELEQQLCLVPVKLLATGGFCKDIRLFQKIRKLSQCLKLRGIVDLMPFRTTAVRCGEKGQTYRCSENVADQSAHLFTLRTLLHAGESVRNEDYVDAQTAVHAKDTAAILFTSGTTGIPKAVPSSHEVRVNNARVQARDLGAGKTDKFCVAIPMFHCFCISANLLAAVSAGACLCFPPSRHTYDLLYTVSTMRCTVFSAVPALFFALMARKDFGSYDISSLRIGLIGGSAYAPQRFCDIERAFGFTLLSSLGQTEATAGFTICSPAESLTVRSTTVGHFMEHVQGCICAPSGTELPPGQTGEICISGYCVMPGYYHAPQQTAQVMDAQGRLHTGDLGFLDTDGNIYLAGRLKDLIIRGGENIAPREVELCLLETCPQISQVKVVGVPDTHYGEELCACVVQKQGAQLTEDAVKNLAARRLAHYKVPKYIVFIKHFPYTANGKIRSADVRAICLQQLAERSIQ
ncbi:MAG: AMP-binding protein, partial [Oscillospiraceae bacterium]|nr:AMP-binding protein [Oscillospiraceae bacterium]